MLTMYQQPAGGKFCDEQWNAVKPATTCTQIQGQTATASTYILQVNKKVSRPALEHMPAFYSMGTAKAEDEYISTLHMPPWCGEGKPYLYLYYAHQITYLRRGGQKLGQTLQLQDQYTFSQVTTVTGQEKAICYNNNMTLTYIKDDSDL